MARFAAPRRDLPDDPARARPKRAARDRPRGHPVPLRLLRRAIRSARVWLFLAGLDRRARRRGLHDALNPPRRLQLPGWKSSYSRTGAEWLGLLIDAASLEPGHTVLDVGCGPGRLAAPIARYLDSGSYNGFDVDPDSITWARREITRRHPNVRFSLADVRNPQYNPTGSQDAASFRFPYPDGRFDVVVATSLLTHLPPDEGERYISEAGRVLRHGGRLLVTFFLLTESRARRS